MREVQNSTVSDDLRNEVFGLWENGRISESDVATDKDVRRACQDLARKSLFFFAKAILGYNRITKASHLRLCQITQDLSIKRQLILQPRGTYKTTIRTKAFACWMIINDPNVRILIANQTAGNAQLMLSEIEQHFSGANPMINWLFPQWVKPNDKWGPWNSGMMVCPMRDIIAGTPTVMTVGTGGRIESQHFEVILTDDLIGEKAMESAIEMLDAIVWHDGIESLFVTPKDGIERMSGTRWGVSDLYQAIIDDPQYYSECLPAINMLNGQLNFPDILDLRTLEQIKERNYALYMSQYMNDPFNPEALEFRKEWLTKYHLVGDAGGEPVCRVESGGHKVDYRVSDMDVVLAVDPAASGDSDSSVTKAAAKGRAKRANNAVEVWGLHSSGNYFLLDMWAGRAIGENPEQQVAQKTLDLFRAWRGYVRKGVLESYGAQAALIAVFNMLQHAQGEHFVLEASPRLTSKSKDVRTRTYLGGPAQGKKIYIRPGHTQFEYEFSLFPQSAQRDCLDAAVWAFAMLRLPESKVEERLNRMRNQAYMEKRRRSIGRTGY